MWWDACHMWVVASVFVRMHARWLRVALVLVPPLAVLCQVVHQTCRLHFVVPTVLGSSSVLMLAPQFAVLGQAGQWEDANPAAPPLHVLYPALRSDHVPSTFPDMLLRRPRAVAQGEVSSRHWRPVGPTNLC